MYAMLAYWFIYVVGLFILSIGVAYSVGSSHNIIAPIGIFFAAIRLFLAVLLNIALLRKCIIV